MKPSRLYLRFFQTPLALLIAANTFDCSTGRSAGLAASAAGVLLGVAIDPPTKGSRMPSTLLARTAFPWTPR